MPEETSLYQQIADNIRQAILQGRLKPGDRLAPVRDLSQEWHCTPGTVQRAYQQLTREGLVVSRAGQGTHVAGEVKPHRPPIPVRRAVLANRAEAFLLESLTAGFSLVEIEHAVGVVMDRWRTLSDNQPELAEKTFRFCGSHDLAISWLAAHFSDIIPGWQIELDFCGSLGGLMALAEGRATLAGCHLWDEESNTYNLPFIRRLFPHQRLVVVTLAQRRLGLILPPGNPLQMTNLNGLAKPGVRFINRQSGSGTRVWLDAQLNHLDIPSDHITGYQTECATHSEVARAIAENKANVGLGLQQAAAAFGLDFVFLTLERYDLVMHAAVAEHPPLADLLKWLSGPEARAAISRFSGYDTSETGKRTPI